MPLLALLDQFALDFPGFCKVGKGHNQKIDFDAHGFIAVAPSVQHLAGLKFEAVFVDEAHHPLPSGMPKYEELYRFSATHTDAPDFRYPMGRAIEDGVLCDYDIAVPAVTEHHAYVCLANLLSKQAGRFRRVLAYCNTVAEAKKFQMALEELGLAAWHINGTTSRKRRMAAIEEFSGSLTSPVHVMVTVEVLGEGINIPNADTCMFVEPRNSYRSVIQAIGRVLRHHPGKTLAHIVLPAVAVPAKVGSEVQEEAWSKAPHHDLRSAEMEETSGGTVHEHASTAENTRPVANTSQLNKGHSAETPQEYPCRPTPVPSSSSFHLMVASSLKDPGLTPRVKTTAKRDGGGEEPAPREDLDDTTASATGGAGQKRTGSESLNLVPSSSSSTMSSSASSSLLRSLSPATAAPTLSSDHGMARRGPHESGRPSQVGPLAEPGVQELGAGQDEPTLLSDSSAPTPGIIAAAGGNLPHPSGRGGDSGADDQHDYVSGVPTMPAEPQQGLGEHGANRGSPSHAAVEQLHDCNIDSAISPTEQQGVKPRAAEAQQRGVAGQSIRRVQLKSSLEPSDPNELYGNQLERFLFLLVQADSRLVGSSVGHRIQLVDCRMTVEGFELDGLIEAVYRRLTAILCQRDPWEERLRSLEAFVEEKGRFPLRKVRDEKHLAHWLNDQRGHFRAGLLLEHRWRRLVNSSSQLIQQH